MNGKYSEYENENKLSSNEVIAKIFAGGGFTPRVKREVLDLSIVKAIKSAGFDGPNWSFIDAINYGIVYYIKTGRACLEIEREISDLSSRKYVGLIARMYEDGIKVP